MREIKFRGKTIKHNNWVYGGYYRSINSNTKVHDNDLYIITTEEIGDVTSMEQIEVDPKTVGQFTGLKDKNGVDIYEGDIVIYRGNAGTPIEKYDRPEEVVWLKEEWCADGFITGYQFQHLLCDYEVIGNIYENPELL